LRASGLPSEGRQQSGKAARFAALPDKLAAYAR
jgi:hypothetical protein